MALREYKCRRCNHSQYVFEGEEHRIAQGNCGKITRWGHDLQLMPPNPVVIHTTDTWMSEPHIDSLHTIYELDRQLNIETREAKEMELFNKVRKEL